MQYLDLFAGAGGLSEGFISAGFTPVAHVESDASACLTLRTRSAYHWSRANNRQEIYKQYLAGKISRDQLYDHLPERQANSVINEPIGKNSIKTIFSKIDSLLDNNQIDLIIGGPPCQAYSVIGRSTDKNKMKNDTRNHLYKYYAKFLSYYRPKYFLFENVTGLLSAKDEKGGLYLDKMRKLFLDVGYETEYHIFSADEYGILQKRRRVIIVGKRGKATNFYPLPNKWLPSVNVAELFKDLPSLKANQGSSGPSKLKKYSGTYLYDSGIKDDTLPVTWHQSRPNTNQDLEIYKIAVKQWNKHKKRLDYNDLPEYLKTHQQRESFLDRFKVVAADLPSAHTIIAHISKDGHYYIHPDIKQNRSLTPREAARIQTFPDNYFFEGGRTAAYRQIGNAVPILLAKKIAAKLLEIWV